MTARTLTAASLTLLLVLAGCHVPTTDEMIVDFSGTIEVTDGEFVMDGVVYASGRPDRQSYDDVTIVLYAADGHTIDSVSLGELASHEEGNVSITTETAPAVVTIDSPEFWNERVTVNYFVRTSYGYVECEAISQSDLPDGPVTETSADEPCPP